MIKGVSVAKFSCTSQAYIMSMTVSDICMFCTICTKSNQQL